ncbi:hypothetical protein Tco_0858219 [Tanacetum coccineum]|uniref:Uncharacterized protein n=1 Tax=Tanacetum coccineum TaxID=301880 RepID=A0ABQ5BAP5_9ASTR
MEALIEDENSMYKGVADTIKNYKRQHDDDEDDDEEPSVGPNQGKKTKRKRTKESKSSMKPSTTKETSKGKAPSKSYKIGNTKDQQPSRDTWFKQPPRPRTPDPEWNKRQVVTNQPAQTWFNHMVSSAKDPLTFDELMATPIDFSNYVMNRLQIDNLTQEIFVGPVYHLLKGTCTSSIELEYNMEDRPGHLTVAAEYFFNNNLEFLKLSDPKKKYTTSITKTKAAQYEIVGIEDMVLTLLSTTKIVVRRANRQVYKFKEGDFVDLHLNDIEDMLLIEVQHKLFQLDAKSYQKKLNIIAPQKTFPEIEFKELYTLLYKPPGVIYEDLNKQKRVMQADELYKFSDGTLKTVHNELHHRILNFNLGYNKEMSRRKWTVIDKRRSYLMVELINKHVRERMIIRNLERLVSARELEMDYKLMTRTD